MQTTIKKMRVDCCDLAIGMYVCELDRPWLGSPFLLQGFYIKDIDDIDTVREICDYVFVDKVVDRESLNSSLPGASSAVLMSRRTTPREKRPDKAGEPTAVKRTRVAEQAIIDFFPDKALRKYTDTETWRSENRKAWRAINYLYDYIVKFMKMSSKSKRLDLSSVGKAVDPMVSSVIRNPDACLWWTVKKPVGSYNNDAALRSSVYAVVLGRQLALPRKDLLALAIGGLLFDVGKLRLDESILLAERKLTAEEITYMQRHVELGLRLLKDSGLDDPDIIDFIANHHERFDGSGYPRGLAGDTIPAYGRIAGLVDCYNAITSSRNHARIKSPAEAINQLYKLQSVHFHKDLIEEFIQAIGVYPVGALVELSSGEVAIVVAQSRARRLRPDLLLLLDANKNPAQEGQYIELDKITHMKNGAKLDIVKNLEPNAYDIDITKVRLQ